MLDHYISTPLNIGGVSIPNRLMVAPMAGVTDRPFRQMCKRLGAGYAVSEMVSAKPDLWKSLKSSRRANHDGETAPISVQIAGTDAQMMADAAQYNMDRGAQIIDINMGCPAKKVCAKWAGSALMQNEALVAEILDAVVAAAEPYRVPVTLKMRTGWSSEQRNASSIARLAEAAGVSMLTVHGRTRQQGYTGRAEHDTLAEIKSLVKIPVVVNGDIDSPEAARRVLAHTGADALMVGRAAQGRPWIFREISHYLTHGECLPSPKTSEVASWFLTHLTDHYGLYGEVSGVRSARKHIGWAVRHFESGEAFRQRINAVQDAPTQWSMTADFFEEVSQASPQWPANDSETARPEGPEPLDSESP